MSVMRILVYVQGLSPMVGVKHHLPCKGWSSVVYVTRVRTPLPTISR